MVIGTILSPTGTLNVTLVPDQSTPHDARSPVKILNTTILITLFILFILFCLFVCLFDEEILEGGRFIDILVCGA